MLSHVSCFFARPGVGRLSWYYETLHAMGLVASVSDTGDQGLHSDGWAATDGRYRVASLGAFYDEGHFGPLEGTTVTLGTRRAATNEEISSEAAQPYFLDLATYSPLIDGEWYGSIVGYAEPVCKTDTPGPNTASYEALHFLNLICRGQSAKAEDLYKTFSDGSALNRWSKLHMPSKFALFGQYGDDLIIYSHGVDVWSIAHSGSYFFSTSKQAIRGAYQYLYKEYKMNFSAETKVGDKSLNRIAKECRYYKHINLEFCKGGTA